MERDGKVETTLEQAFVKGPKGIRVTPPGLGFVNLLENSRIDFHRTDLDSLAEMLRALSTQELWIAGDFKIKVDGMGF